ncbi:alpha/beta-hydrolase [Gymnopus androsaceus JB14]|uniref:Alpha/beta-hydrolase n=1 Tax=Gymnopus androsaceus JB14 TaxID=1447944 RepID=A0A6A4GYT6_9AGAR|nr:alpha/beta-hydrolase [Gymnopus androsaceus JB14]
MKNTFSLLSLAFGCAGALALPSQPLSNRANSVTPLTTAQVTTYLPYTYFAAAAYCTSSVTSTWTSNCQKNSDFIPVAAGGDGTGVQYWYAGYSPSLDSVVVAHQGTNTSSIEAILTDGEFSLTSLDTTLFPGLDSSIEADSGFLAEQAKTATDVLAAVQDTLASYPTSTITLIGHSLGGAIALIDSVYLPLWLPDMTYRTVTYGLPRVGNAAWATQVDAVTDITHINNKEEDLVPILPGERVLGYVHPTGEIHIEDSGTWEACAGQDNDSDLCSTGDVPNIFEGDISCSDASVDHDGPYDDVQLGSAACPL